MSKGICRAAGVAVALILYAQLTGSAGAQQAPAASANPLVNSGGSLFQTNCGFCHGRDAAGGETGPDLTHSQLVISDKAGSNIFAVVRSGRTDKGMPAFNFSEAELNSLQAFLHDRVRVASTQNGQRRGVTVADLQTGNAAAGKAYFEGAGGCVKCHSATGDLKGIAGRLQGLRLEQRMLYPGGGRYRPKATVTAGNGQTVSGELMYRDEFTIGVRDAGGTYHSWAVSKVKIVVDDPVRAHVDLFPKYTDDDIHNLMAYMQTLR